MKRPLIAACLLFAACEASRSPPPGGEARDASQPQDAAAQNDASTSPDAGTMGSVRGLSLFTRLPGLWAGSANATPLGDFPRMIFDLRAASDHVLFGRVDL